MDFNTRNSQFQEDFQRNSNFEYDQKLNQFTFQQIEIYIQTQVFILITNFHFSN